METEITKLFKIFLTSVIAFSMAFCVVGISMISIAEEHTQEFNLIILCLLCLSVSGFISNYIITSIYIISLKDDEITINRALYIMHKHHVNQPQEFYSTFSEKEVAQALYKIKEIVRSKGKYFNEKQMVQAWVNGLKSKGENNPVFNINEY